MFDSILQLFSQLFTVFALHLSYGNFPRPLPPAEESKCFRQARGGDAKARDKLISHNLRLVAHIVKKYFAVKMEQDDLISIGTIGLIKAVDSFNVDKKTRFATYASRCIENEILMTFRAIRREQNTMYMDDSLGADDDGNAITAADTLGDDGDMAAELEHELDIKMLAEAVKQLPEREQTVARLRFGLSGNRPLTQQEVATRLGISRSYVSRIETAAVQALRRMLKQRPI